jgi:hypothetical protein
MSFAELLHNDYTIILMCHYVFKMKKKKKAIKNAGHISIFLQLLCKIVVQLTYFYYITNNISYTILAQFLYNSINFFKKSTIKYLRLICRKTNQTVNYKIK